MTTHITNAETLPARWITSTYSGGGNNCIQVATLADGTRAVRDSKHPTGPALLFTKTSWDTFVTAIRTGEHTG